MTITVSSLVLGLVYALLLFSYASARPLQGEGLANGFSHGQLLPRTYVPPSGLSHPLSQSIVRKSMIVDGGHYGMLPKGGPVRPSGPSPHSNGIKPLLRYYGDEGVIIEGHHARLP